MFFGLEQDTYEVLPSAEWAYEAPPSYEQMAVPELWTVYEVPTINLSSVSTEAQRSSTNILPVLSNIITSAGAVIGKVFETKAVKEQAEAAKAQAETLARLRTTTIPAIQPTQPLKIAGIDWPILAIIGIGAFIVLRGKKKEERRIRRRKRTAR